MSDSETESLSKRARMGLSPRTLHEEKTARDDAGVSISQKSLTALALEGGELSAAAAAGGGGGGGGGAPPAAIPFKVLDADRPEAFLFNRATSFGNETGELATGFFEVGSGARAVSRARILVLGAGGLGCELLKGLALSGFTDVHVIDMDTIDLTNLNRQFLFRVGDIGSKKADVAARAVMARVGGGVKITPHACRLQEKTHEWFAQFACVVGGLDNIEARRWMNHTLVKLVRKDAEGDIDPDSVIPYVDGGTTGWGGQAMVIVPTVSACFDCMLDLFPPVADFPLCTIEATPRLPEHCIAYAMQVLWEAQHPTRKYDTDSPDDMSWICERAQERATTFNISGVTYALTLGVVKRIVPAIASTNAIVAAVCVAETLKIITSCSQLCNNFFSYIGATGVSSDAVLYDRRADTCPVCSFKSIVYSVPPSMTLSALVERVRSDDFFKFVELELGVFTDHEATAASFGLLFAQNIKMAALRSTCESYLTRTLMSLGIAQGDELRVGKGASSVKLQIVFDVQDEDDVMQ
jgi:ubiquitin-activating enzyme E1 C